jgi:small subunit ribosomal protein S5e
MFLYYSDYIQIRAPVYISHSAGRYAVKRFRKAQCPIIERLTNSLMMNGRNNGKKLMAVRIVAHAFEVVRQPSSSSPKASQVQIQRKLILANLRSTL